MEYYIGLDVSQRQTAICIVNGKGTRVAEGKALTEPSGIYAWITKHLDTKLITTVGLEAGAMSAWLYTELSKMDLPMLCLESYQAAEFLKAQRNKTDRNDARGLAQMVRMGGDFIKPVIIRSQCSQEARALLRMRQFLVHQKVSLENNITGSLKPFGLIVPRGKACAKTFRDRVLAILDRADERGILVRESVMPSLDLYENLRKQLDVVSKKVVAKAKADPVCRRLMTAPGVGPIVALSFVTAVDNPKRFADAGDIGAYFGLTPRQYQSGETDIRGNTSRRGDVMTRYHLVQAATVVLTSTKNWCALKAWGMKIAKRHGFSKARIAVARKLAIILCKMWLREQDFCWTKVPANSDLAGAIAA
ncbi:MAG TPA: IS110 family transposase [Terriglobia bacterium]|nr:IS110 family transposase [Terriglobia bacterium]